MIMDSETYDKIHDHYVAQGVAVLDSFRPGWRDSVNADRLDMGDATLCVLGQVYAAEHKVKCDAYEDALTSWQQSGYAGPCPKSPGREPFFHGRNALIVATGGELTSDYEARDQWAADHGFLAHWAPVDVSAWSDDPEVQRMPLIMSDLNAAWTRALAR